jgi:hypothetical protein
LIRIPSFNDFSPGLIGDIREVVRAVKELGPDRDAVYQRWADLNFSGVLTTRSTTNTRSTLTSTGVITAGALKLTVIGEQIADAQTLQQAILIFCKHIIERRNGDLLIRAVSNLNGRQKRVTKVSLSDELRVLGVQLSRASTDHTTLANWMAEAKLLNKEKNFKPNDTHLKELLGISSAESFEWDTLPLEQQILLQSLRRLAALEPDGAVSAQRVYDECFLENPELFDAAQLQRKVTTPLELAGWLTVERPRGRQGGKSGTFRPSEKLMSIPLAALVPDIDQVIPADLLSKLNMPLPDIQAMLGSESTYDRGLALELLTLRILIDLRLVPQSFRVRTSETGGAEVDLIAEAHGLLFSRWSVQCKNISTNVTLSDIAKEVGVATLTKANVVLMMSTSGFTKAAIEFARQITRSSHLQFVFIDGRILKMYLQYGGAPLWRFFQDNSESVGVMKRSS